jgi:DNA-binding response OmpR family regulator
MNTSTPRPGPGQKKPTILIVDDEPFLRETIRDILSPQFNTIEAENGLQALQAVEQNPVDLILLDIMMPELDGIAVCEKIQANPRTTHIPVLMLTAANSALNRVKAFNLGADDFIPKPFSIEELLARVNSKWNRSQKSRETASGTLEVFDLSLNLDNLEAKVRGVGIDLSAFEFKLLRLFTSRLNTIVNRSDILAQVWGNTEVPTRLIDAHIVSLRKNLKGSQLYLKTIYGMGYMMKARESGPHEENND